MNDERNKEILYLRFGLLDGEFYTLQEIGVIYNVTRERIRQIINSAIKKIRYHSNRGFVSCRYFINSIYDWVAIGSEKELLNIALLIIRLNNFPKTLITNLLCKLCLQSRGDSNTNEKIVSNYVVTIQKSLLESAFEKRRQKEQYEKIFNQVIWHEYRMKFLPSELDSILPKRTVNHSSTHYSGSFYSAKNNKEIEYESLLEYNFCMYLEEVDKVIAYVHQPVKINYRFENGDHVYYPDFLVVLEDGSAVLVEIKGRNRMALFKNLIKFNALHRYCEFKGLGYLIIEKNQSFLDYVNRRLDPQKETSFLNQIQQKDMDWYSYNKIRVELGITTDEFISLIVKNNLKWTLSPFLISKNNPVSWNFAEKQS
ncbi:sigma factor-like helix-turn-helix DNA-binding protein [Jeotgalibacillus sp. JSM ZJ347]|uniref:sigma factor-like helix-turn-helix DNA-binding protein n=1 Tax=Jeotgalibacillus sp. JSM ZJ347 TaxID=3342117 RepID=UPI0035A8ADC9